jgi:hypothetical protein
MGAGEIKLAVSPEGIVREKHPFLIAVFRRLRPSHDRNAKTKYEP